MGIGEHGAWSAEAWPVNGWPGRFVLDHLMVGAVSVNAVSLAASTALGVEARITDLRVGSARGRRDETRDPVEYEGYRHAGCCASPDLVEAVARARPEALNVLPAGKPARRTGAALTKHRRGVG